MPPYLKENRGFIKEKDGEIQISTAAILLFGKNPQNFFPRARIRFIRYEGTEEKFGTEMNVIKDVIFEGTLLNMINEAIAYLDTQVKEKTYLGPDGTFVTDEEYPKFVRQELIVNAVTHRAYSITGTDIQIKMFDDHIVVESPGKLPGLVRADNIRFTHFSRNPKIAEFLKNYKFVKEFGEGVNRMCNELEQVGLQNKRLFAENEVVHGISDMILPDGIDSDDSCIAAEIKMYRHKQMSLRVIYDTIGRFSINRGEINKLLLIVVNELPDGIRNRIEEKKKQLNFELIIWDIDDLVRIFSYNESLFVDTYNNLNAVLLRDTINNGISRNNSTYLEKRKKYVEQLHTQYENDNIVLFLGAGASNEAKIATWDTLISELFVALIDKQLSANHIQIEKKDKKKIVKEVINQNGNSPLLQTRFLRNGFENDFEELVRDILYKSAVDTSDLLEEIGQLCMNCTLKDQDEEDIQSVIDFIKENPEKTSSDIIEYLDELGI